MNKETFRNPPMSHRGAPFWSWNGKLTPAETRWQVREMTDKGLGGGFMHARFGLATEYLGEDWFASCAASIDEGKKLGFSSWLYDEDCWPSGDCAGRTSAANPDFCARSLVWRRGDGALQPGGRVLAEDMAPLARFRIVEEPGREPELHPATPQDEGFSDVVTFFAALVAPNGPTRDFHADLMHDGAMREFIANSYEPYAQRFQSEFGKAVPGIFTDEPQIYGPFPWSVRLPGEFQKRRGYDLLAALPHLIWKTARSTKVRHDYWQTVYELYDEAFSEQIGRWCREHGLHFTGHYNAEGTISQQMRSGGGVMHHYLHQGVPGIDILREQLLEVLTCKQCSSVVHQFNKPRMLSELYGCTGYNFTFEGQKWIGDWQMALGVDLLCQHLTHYTLKGSAKRDYPPSYSYQTPWWRHFRHVADYQARLAWVLTQGAPVREILVVHPLTSGWTHLDVSLPDSDFGLRTMTSYFNGVMQCLLDLHRDFDLGDEWLMADHGRVDGKEIVVGSARYKAVIVPRMPNIESRTLDLLEAFAKAGGHVTFLEQIPSLVDGEPSDRARKLAYSPGVHRASSEKRHLEEILQPLLPRAVSVRSSLTGEEAAGVLCQHRLVDGAQVLFVANTDRAREAPLTVSAEGQGEWEQWDCETGAVRGLGAGPELALTLPPVGSAVLRRAPGAAKPASAPKGARRVRSLVPRGGWSFQRVAPNSLVLDRCTWCIDGGAFSETMLTLSAQEQWRKIFSLYSIHNTNSAFQPWKLLLDPQYSRPLGRLTLRYPFAVDVLPASEVYLVLEDRADAEIFVNGTRVDSPSVGWFMDKSFEKVPVGGFLKAGENLVEVQFTLTPLRRAEDMYLIGDFGVDPKTYAITREPKKLATGDWCPQGYPFYSDAMIYRATYNAGDKPRRAAIEIDGFQGPAAAVWVNGKKAGVIGWRPYCVDITDFLQPGENEIGIEIVGSPRNLMGPRHSAERYPGWTGPAQMAETHEPGYHITPAGLAGGVRLVVG